MKALLVTAIVLANLICLAYCQRKAVCVLQGTDWSPYTQGTLYLDSSDDGLTSTITGTITGVPKNGVFGFHVHDFGHIGTPNGAGAGSHFNPTNVAHALPPAVPRHIGDMGNVTSDQFGSISVSLSGAYVLWSLNGTNSVVGHAIILHSKNDDGTGATGNAGNRLAQCVIGIRNNSPNFAVKDTYAGTYATAEVRGILPTSTSVRGRVTFTATGGKVRVKGKVAGFPPGSIHGFHVHEFGDISGSPADTTLGNHFNPFTTPHGYPDNAVRHVGDMGNVTADANGVVSVDLTLDLLTLSGNNSIIGRAVVLHSQNDDGNQPFGNAGSKYVAGIIGVIDTDLAFTDIMASGNQSAVCVLEPINGSNVAGVLTLTIDNNFVPKIAGSITGLAPNSVHGVHIHMNGYLTPDGQGVGSHFNPTNVTHGLPGVPVRHIGDMGNMTADANGVITVNLVGNYFLLWRLNGMLSAVGRGLIVHSGVDDGTDPAGNSGTRLAQCVIGVARAPTLADNQAIADDPTIQFATCEIRVAKPSYGNITGRVAFSVAGNTVHVSAKICGLPPNTQHGFHVHEFGDTADPTDLSANSGGHFNPTNQAHGLPNNAAHHVGDMGNLQVDANGVGAMEQDIPTLALNGLNSIIGRVVVVHAGQDDGVSQPSGNSGTKWAVCVVGAVDRQIPVTSINCPPAPPGPGPSSKPPGPKPSKAAASTAYVSMIAFIASVLAVILML